MSAFMEAAPDAYSHTDRAILEKEIGSMTRGAPMQLSANVEGSPPIN